MIEEEGRRTVFTIACVTPGQARLFGASTQVFVTAAPCEAAAIAKLAPAAHPRETLLGVRWNPAGLAEVWGLVHLGDRTFEIDLEHALPFLRLHGFRPGGFAADMQMQRLLMYSNGIARWYDPNTDTITALLREALRPTAQRLHVTPGALSHSFERLAERLVQAGHGGALLVSGPIDPRFQWKSPTGVQIGTSFRKPDRTLTDAFRRHEGTVGGELEQDRRKAEREHRGALDHVARLANVDGAVVMGPDLRVHGFAATIKVGGAASIGPIELHDLTVPGSRPRSLTLTDFKGHRHKSAASFCWMQRHHRNRLAFAVVASQDGALSLFAIAGAKVVVYRPFQLRSAR